MAQPIRTDITFEEYLACTHISQQWANSYDTKDWSLLSSIITPSLHINYTSVMGPSHLFPSMSSSSYVTMMSSPSTLGHPLVATQHFLSTPSFTRTSEDEITGTYQLRAHHVRFSSDDQGDIDGYAKGRGRKVLAVATGYAVIQHFYRRTGEGWKLSGLRPEVLFDDGDLKGLFAWKEEVGDGALTP
ncbi:hypothetical protein E8E12_003883 [Didymella heteroderae]|uniref:Scytalone dehydratase-like domain-containing protein n=1 Tax=Didymella heteroderae TaxID=1769908 RepID=A0A9P4WM15_9PLEO|nr:hypothetical protein E8E12_003883 [Didymella heteroderae]